MILTTLLSVSDSLLLQSKLEELAYKIDNQNNIINSVNQFYDSAWLKLVFVVTLLFIIIPILNQITQNRNIKELKEELKKNYENKINEIDEKNEKIIADYQNQLSKIKDEYKNQLSQIKDEFEELSDMQEASIFYLQGRAYFNERKFVNACSDFFNSVLFLIKCKSTQRVKATLSWIKSSINNFEVKSNFAELDNIVSLRNNDFKSFDELMDYIESQEKDSETTSILFDIRELHKNKLNSFN